MTRTTSINSLLLTLLCLSISQEMFVSAQALGTVPSVLFDYNMKMNNNTNTPQQSSPTGPASPSFSITPPQQETTDSAAANTGTNSAGSGSNLYDMYSMMMQPYPQTTSSPWSPSEASFGMTSMDVFNQMFGGSQTQTQGVSSSSTGSASSPSDPVNLYKQVIQAVNPSSPQVQPQSHSQSQVPPFADPFLPTPATVTLEPTPKILPFVPPEWNITGSDTQRQSAWESSPSNATLSGWSPNTPRHSTPAQTPHPPHPIFKFITMNLRIRETITKQATQFGDIAYYQQHGCVDPTPTNPGPEGIRLTQTLRYGCNSPVSRMVCLRVGKQASGRSNTITLIMSMLNPAMTRTFEKCLTPKMVTQMMFQGFSGGSGGMSPKMMMALSGGGGGGMAAMVPMVMSMMKQQNQAAAPSATSNILPPAPAGAGFGSGSPTANKQMYPNPSQTNTLVNQTARTSMGDSQPSAQSYGSSLMSAFNSLFGMGGSQTPLSSGLHPGPATPGSAHASSAQAPASSVGGAGIDCSSVMPLVMSKMIAAGDGLNSPEAMEVIEEMRKQFLPYSCQELRTKYMGLPFRMCCPGKVEPPTVFDLLKAKNAAGA